MAAEAGTRLDLDDIDRAARSTPVIADLMPSGRYSVVEMFEAGGVAAVAAPLRAAGFLTDTPSVTGNNLFAELDKVPTATANHQIVLLVDKTLRPHSSIVVI